MGEREDLEKAFDAISEKPEAHMLGVPYVDLRDAKLMKLLGKTIRLDRSNGKLALINMGLAIVMAIAAFVQIWLTLRQH